MTQKLKVAILFGGRSTEHEISLLSAQNVLRSLDRERFDPVLIGIDKKGRWHYNKDSMDLLNSQDASKISMNAIDSPVLLSQNADEKRIISLENNEEICSIDVIFPVLHGTYGEDGSVQGFAKLANIACVGCDILGSAVGMDKDIMKRILRDSDIKVAKWLTQRASDPRITYAEASEKLGAELFVKPANLGSSVGVSFADNEKDFDEALESALSYDPKVIIEEKLSGREIECAVLGNQHPKASIAGEVIPKNDFYSFESKYLDENGATLKIPAELDADQLNAIQKISLETYKVLECKGMARVDVFLIANGDIYINEINTIPGFTNISMYPKLWEISGIPQKELVSKLIDFALEAHEQQNKLRLT